MCGRYANDLPLELIARAFRARNNIGDFGPRYNAAPTQMLPVVRWNAEAGERSLDLLRCCCNFQDPHITSSRVAPGRRSNDQ